MSGWFNRNKKEDTGPRFVTINEEGETVEVDVNRALYGAPPSERRQPPPQQQRPPTQPTRPQYRPRTPTPPAAQPQYGPPTQGMYAPRSRARGGYDFAPMPPAPKRGWLRWIILALNAIPFALIIFGYPLLEENAPEIFVNNIAWLVIPAWGLLLIVHLLLVSLLEMREGVVITRKERRRRQQYEEMQAQVKRQRMADSVQATRSR